MTAVTLPPLPRFTLPQALHYLEPIGCDREHLIEYLKAGSLHAVCFPFVKDASKAVSISAKEWHEHYPESYMFSPYYGWFGDVDEANLGRTDPLQLVPDAVAHHKGEVHADNTPVIESAVVYIMRDELVRFIEWLTTSAQTVGAAASPGDRPTSPPSPRSTRSGRPRQYDYSEVDPVLADIYRREGVRGFDRPARVGDELEHRLGRAALPPRNVLLQHVRRYRDSLRR